MASLRIWFYRRFHRLALDRDESARADAMVEKRFQAAMAEAQEVSQSMIQAILRAQIEAQMARSVSELEEMRRQNARSREIGKSLRDRKPQ